MVAANDNDEHDSFTRGMRLGEFDRRNRRAYDLPKRVDGSFTIGYIHGYYSEEQIV